MRTRGTSLGMTLSGLSWRLKFEDGQEVVQIVDDDEDPGDDYWD